MRRWYPSTPTRWWRTLGDVQVLWVSAAVVFGVWLATPSATLVVAMVAFVRRARLALSWCCVSGCLLGALASERAWSEAQPRRLGPVEQRICLVSDPAPRHGAVVAVFEIDGERFESWAYGSAARRLTNRLAGECASVTGARIAPRADRVRRLAIRHVVGALRIEHIAEWDHGARLGAASNRVRRLLAAGAGQLGAPRDALFAGLVIGDDRHQPPAMIDDFRAAGLSHLTAVSGSNVAFVLAAAAPALRRTGPRLRWAVTIGLIAWFVALTRFEPSILRAGVMAGIAATGVLRGRERPPGRVLCLAVAALALIDPMLVWSVGFWLSVSATAGVALLGPACARALPGPRWLTTPLGVTLGAQIAVFPVSTAVFGPPPLVSIPANLLAAPVAALVMLYGLPAGLLAGALGGAAARLVQLPSEAAVGWVEAVATHAAPLQTSAIGALAGWLAIGAWLGRRVVVGRRATVCQGGVDGGSPGHRR